ncbi:hypothetical protein ANME2D_01066 [Candidatus Methanoperedens nitroreducens]|uniref:Uncharacterized protein n=1 Tax=Candidatus Methanoperedens nitratireducens TaxID=1392998 RepID=A0A062VBE5_9EURY|nr:hypothetical protein [Candidatus Methanoperedens nitroreducens]KCZ72635.1 hypothetical protein ANME2D_01066 [Candidatus Methanoperedens nitroreducens]MDJ1423432.1 hypothetical protein [Candidatus Methanoperedens sp.]
MFWSIQFYYNKNLDPVFINKLFYFLVSRGLKYNVKYEGYYSIISKVAYSQPGKDIIHSEKEINESTEKLAEIIYTYLNFNLQTTSLGINLGYLDEVKFPFNVGVHPVEDNKSLISFETNEYCMADEKTFLAFINLCKEVFDRFNFVHGAFRSEYQDDIPFNEEDFLKVLPDIVNFYSKPLVDKIGREKLLSAPARKVEQLENGGIMLLVCILHPEQLGCPDELDSVRLHLGYELRYV